MQLHAFPSNETRNKVLTVYGIRGPSGLGMIQLFEAPPLIDGFDVRIEALASSDLVAARFIAGEAKIGILPPDRAAKIASSGMNIKTAAVIGMGMLSLLTSDSQVRSLDDLRGKTVEVAGQGTIPEYVFRRILVNHGLRPETDVRLGFSLAPPEIAQSLIAGRISTALLPEPFATMAIARKPDLRHIVNIQDEWRITTGTQDYPMTVLAVDGNFAAQNPAALSIILAALEDSIKWVVRNPEDAGILAEKHNLGFPAAAAALAVPRSNYVFIPAREARASMESLFRVFLDFSPESIGGRLPADSFYLP
jgi:NitT/TauT family transport system substrate-binding protein